jgi:hypothetical protein
MSRAEKPDLILFVAGEPFSGQDPMRDVQISIVRRTVNVMTGGSWLDNADHRPRSRDDPPTRLGDERPWHLPPQQILCANLVLKTAQLRRRSVAVVDANRPAGFEDLVQRWVGPNDVLPLLVRPDGARLEGVEDFTSRKVRQFIGPR